MMRLGRTDWVHLRRGAVLLLAPIAAQKTRAEIAKGKNVGKDLKALVGLGMVSIRREKGKRPTYRITLKGLIYSRFTIRRARHEGNTGDHTDSGADRLL